MSETWRTERMYIQTDNGTFLARAFSLEDAATIVMEHNAMPIMLKACKEALEVLEDIHAEDVADAMPAVQMGKTPIMEQLRAAIALAEKGDA